MLDRTDFESCQQRIRLYCLGKENGENTMKSINKGPFQMGTGPHMLLLRKLRVQVQQGPYVLSPKRTFQLKETGKYKADIRATNILLQGSELTKDDRELIIYDEFEHFCQTKEKPFKDTKLGLQAHHDMRKIQDDHAQEAANSKFVNNILPEGVHLNPHNEPLATSVGRLSLSAVSNTTTKSKETISCRTTFKWTSGISSHENLIGKLSNTLPPHTLFKNVRGRNNATKSRKTISKKQCKGNCEAGNVGGQNRVDFKKFKPTSRTRFTNASPGEWSSTDEDSRCFLQGNRMGSSETWGPTFATRRQDSMGRQPQGIREVFRRNHYEEPWCQVISGPNKRQMSTAMSERGWGVGVVREQWRGDAGFEEETWMGQVWGEDHERERGDEVRGVRECEEGASLRGYGNMSVALKKCASWESWGKGGREESKAGHLGYGCVEIACAAGVGRTLASMGDEVGVLRLYEHSVERRGGAGSIAV
ncbi:hypothetical protein Tco_0519364 [Tanacetum coccineum]